MRLVTFRKSGLNHLACFFLTNICLKRYSSCMKCLVLMLKWLFSQTIVITRESVVMGFHCRLIAVKKTTTKKHAHIVHRNTSILYSKEPEKKSLLVCTVSCLICSLREAVGSYAENQRISAVRKVYQRGVTNPMIHIEILWKEYCAYENVSILLEGHEKAGLARSFVLDIYCWLMRCFCAITGTCNHAFACLLKPLATPRNKVHEET